MADNRAYISELWIYPVKSLGGITLSSANLMEKGLRYDRRFMLADAAGRAVTQRDHPALCLFKTSLSGDMLTIYHPAGQVTISMQPPADSKTKKATVWDDDVITTEPDERVSEWFSERIGFETHLLYFPESNPRPVDRQYAASNENVSLADAFPVLLIGQSSLDDLNRRLEEPLGMDRFRPNIVVRGTKPFEEDTWSEFMAGESRLKAVKPCARCVLTTVNQVTAERGKEPLKTLATYRTQNNKIYFGQNTLILSGTEIKTGDAVSVISYR